MSVSPDDADEIHRLFVEDLKAKLRSGEASPATLAVILKFLMHNKIEVGPANKEIEKLRRSFLETLPFSDPEEA